MKISIPELSLVILIGPSGCGKSTFARKHFLSTEVVSSDVCRALVADDENDQTATGDAFDLLHEIVRKRLSRGKLAVVDATNVQPESRKSIIELAREYHVLPVAFVFDLSERLCQDRNTLRSDRQFGPHVVRNQIQQLRRSLRGLEREGFRYVHKLASPEEIEAVTIERQPLWNNKRDEHGPFDIIGFARVSGGAQRKGIHGNASRWPQTGFRRRSRGSRSRHSRRVALGDDHGECRSGALCAGQSRH